MTLCHSREYEICEYVLHRFLVAPGPLTCSYDGLELILSTLLNLGKGIRDGNDSSCLKKFETRYGFNLASRKPRD